MLLATGSQFLKGRNRAQDVDTTLIPRLMGRCLDEDWSNCGEVTIKRWHWRRCWYIVPPVALNGFGQLQS